MRCHICDLDGYLIEVSQATGMVHRVFADAPAGIRQGSTAPDRPAGG